MTDAERFDALHAAAMDYERDAAEGGDSYDDRRAAAAIEEYEERFARSAGFAQRLPGGATSRRHSPAWDGDWE